MRNWISEYRNESPYIETIKFECTTHKMLQDKLIVLTDIPGWVQPLRAALEAEYLPVEVVDILSDPWQPSDPVPKAWKLVINRISARPTSAAIAVCAAVTLARDRLAALDVASAICNTPRRVIHGATTQMVSASKCCQASVFAALGLRTPLTRHATMARMPQHLGSAQTLLKPNVGGKGVGMHPLVHGSLPEGVDVGQTFEADGTAIVQDVITSVDGFSYRMEILGGKCLYAAKVRLEPASYNTCLGDICTRRPKESITVIPVHEVTAQIVADCEAIAGACGMQLGSVEWFMVSDDDGAGSVYPSYFDINPVSTTTPLAGPVLGADPILLQARWLKSLWDGLQ